jgi:hypothetical protein
MDRSTVKFAFKDSVPMPEVEATLRLALLAAESLHGEDRVRIETRARLDRGGRACVIDTATEVGRTLAAIFGGYVRREFGEEAIGIYLAMAGTCDPAGSVA